jgi:plasmid stabilization system protein ParE
MTKLRWTDPANADFLGVVKWLKTKNPDAAARVGRRILDDMERLLDFPYLGKPGRSPDTRELAVTSYPYLIVYDVEHDETISDKPQTIIILRVLHGAMQWPPEE